MILNKGKPRFIKNIIQKSYTLVITSNLNILRVIFLNMTLVPPSCKKCGNGNELKLIKSTDSKSKNYNKQDYKCLKCGNEFSMRYPYSGLQKDGSYIIY